MLARIARGVTLLAMLAAATVAPAGAGTRDPRLIPLVDDRGTAFTLDQLSGKATVITFIATRCTDACPIANGAFYALSRKLRADRVPASVLTITLDPAYDTPFVMSQFAKQFGDDNSNWRFASGRAADVRALLSSFGVVSTLNRAHVPEEHTSFVYVLDRHVRLAKTFLLSNRLTAEVEPEARALDETDH